MQNLLAFSASFERFSLSFDDDAVTAIDRSHSAHNWTQTRTLDAAMLFVAAVAATCRSALSAETVFLTIFSFDRTHISQDARFCRGWYCNVDAYTCDYDGFYFYYYFEQNFVFQFALSFSFILNIIICPKFSDFSSSAMSV